MGMWGENCVLWPGSCSYYKSVSWDQVLFMEILIYIFIKKTVWWWGKIWFIL